MLTVYLLFYTTLWEVFPPPTLLVRKRCLPLHVQSWEQLLLIIWQIYNVRSPLMQLEN